jgi:DMSO reductase family type II enzyme chaperone
MNALLSTVPEVVQARKAVYRLLLCALGRPTADQHAWMRGAEFRGLVEGLCETFGVAWPAGDWVPEDLTDQESRYLACFEVGLPEPPVVLLASRHNHREPAPRIIHEHILIYRCFGVQVPADSLEPADHLLNQLGFLLWLDELLLAGTLDPVCVLRARRDFLKRHVVGWVPRAAEAARRNHLPGVYCALLTLLAAALAQDLELTAGALADLAPEIP